MKSLPPTVQLLEQNLKFLSIDIEDGRADKSILLYIPPTTMLQCIKVVVKMRSPFLFNIKTIPMVVQNI